MNHGVSILSMRKRRLGDVSDLLRGTELRGGTETQTQVIQAQVQSYPSAQKVPPLWKFVLRRRGRGCAWKEIFFEHPHTVPGPQR